MAFAAPSVFAWVALPGWSIAATWRLPVQFLAYSWFPPTLGLWFQVGGAVVLMSAMASSRITPQQYAAVFAAGAAVGGAVFMMSNPHTRLAGPTMATYGLLGGCLVYAIREWHWLSIPARLYSLLLVGVSLATIGSVAISSSQTRLAEAAALIGGSLVAVRMGVGRPKGASGKAECDS